MEYIFLAVAATYFVVFWSFIGVQAANKDIAKKSLQRLLDQIQRDKQRLAENCESSAAIIGFSEYTAEYKSWAADVMNETDDIVSIPAEARKRQQYVRDEADRIISMYPANTKEDTHS